MKKSPLTGPSSFDSPCWSIVGPLPFFAGSVPLKRRSSIPARSPRKHLPRTTRFYFFRRSPFRSRNLLLPVLSLKFRPRLEFSFFSRAFFPLTPPRWRCSSRHQSPFCGLLIFRPPCPSAPRSNGFRRSLPFSGKVPVVQSFFQNLSRLFLVPPSSFSARTFSSRSRPPRVFSQVLPPLPLVVPSPPSSLGFLKHLPLNNPFPRCSSSEALPRVSKNPLLLPFYLVQVLFSSMFLLIVLPLCICIQELRAVQSHWRP